MVLLTAADGLAGGVRAVGKQKPTGVPASPKTPPSSAVKLDRDMFINLWWICRCEKGEDDRPLTPADVLLQLAGQQLEAWRKRYDAKIAKLSKLDQAEAEVLELPNGPGE
jgi:hypothetical protein